MSVFAAAAILQAALVPNGPWQTGVLEGRCSAVLSYGAEASPVTWVISSPLGGEPVAKIILPASMDQGGPTDEVKTVFAPGGEHFSTSNQEAYAVDASGRKTRIALQTLQRTRDGRHIRTAGRISPEAMTGASQVAVTIGGSGPIAFQTPAPADALAAMAACNRGKLKAAGLSEADLERPAMEAIPDPGMAAWINHKDYPARAVAKKAQGNVILAFFAEPDGSLRDCRIISSSGSDLLDEHSCGLLRKRGRFQPARNSQGQAVRQLFTREVVWSLPQLTQSRVRR